MGGTQWTCFSKSFYLLSFGGQPDNFLPQQTPKPVFFHFYRIQNLKSTICGTFCLYFFYLIERMEYNNAVLKMCFGLTNRPINAFSSTTGKNSNTIGTSSFDQKH